MATECSFDIVSEVDLQEIDNAVNQALKEIRNRYDFKGSKSDLQFDRTARKLTILADNEMRLKSVTEALHTKLVKRGVSIKALKYGAEEKAFDGMIRQAAEVIQGIEHEAAKDIVKRIKELKLKIQPAIQGERIRVSGRSKDDLQTVIQCLKNSDLPIPLQFVNYR